jgi:hypothetical protein
MGSLLLKLPLARLERRGDVGFILRNNAARQFRAQRRTAVTIGFTRKTNTKLSG